MCFYFVCVCVCFIDFVNLCAVLVLECCVLLCVMCVILCVMSYSTTTATRYKLICS
jgi:hypothetical protein